MPVSTTRPWKGSGGALPAGTSALGVTTSKYFVESVREAATDEDTLTLAQDIADEISGNLNAGQDLLMALVITEDAVAATKVVAGPDAVAIFGLAATDEGVFAGAAVATDGGVAAVRHGVAGVEQPALGLPRVSWGAEFGGSGPRKGVGVLEQHAEHFPGRLALGGEFG